ncbi:hypothetical protein ACWFRM_14330 [Streptomyces sp. NPDC055144]
MVSCTRWAALIASGAMAFAYFDVHQRVALSTVQNGGVPLPSVLFCFFLLIFTGSGSGVFGVDRLIDERTAGTPRRSPSRPR